MSAPSGVYNQVGQGPMCEAAGYRRYIRVGSPEEQKGVEVRVHELAEQEDDNDHDN